MGAAYAASGRPGGGSVAAGPQQQQGFDASGIDPKTMGALQYAAPGLAALSALSGVPNPYAGVPYGAGRGLLGNAVAGGQGGEGGYGGNVTGGSTGALGAGGRCQAAPAMRRWMPPLPRLPALPQSKSRHWGTCTMSGFPTGNVTQTLPLPPNRGPGPTMGMAGGLLGPGMLAPLVAGMPHLGPGAPGIPPIPPMQGLMPPGMQPQGMQLGSEQMLAYLVPQRPDTHPDDPDHDLPAQLQRYAAGLRPAPKPAGVPWQQEIIFERLGKDDREIEAVAQYYFRIAQNYDMYLSAANGSRHRSTTPGARSVMKHRGAARSC